MQDIGLIKASQIACFNDLCGCGSCSLKIVLPVLTTAGCDCLACPTALLSAHTAYPDFAILDTTTQLRDCLGSWQNLSVSPNAIFTGFFANPEQIELVRNYAEHVEQELNFLIVDPVLGDGGHSYKTCTVELCNEMKKLAARADILTPNLTEASLLLSRDYDPNIDFDQAREICLNLQQLGSKNVILKGIVCEGEIYNCLLSAQGDFELIVERYIPTSVFGSGDLFASLLVAMFIRSADLLQSCKVASSFTRQAIEKSLKYSDYRLRGIYFESVLPDFASSCAKYSISDDFK